MRGIKSVKFIICAAIAFALIFITGYFFLIMPRIFSRPDFTLFKGIYFAHRGLFEKDSDHPENSLAAFRRAADKGYAVELDIRLTKDGKVVVFHDDDLHRVCGVDGNVRDFTYEELQKFSLFGTEEKIPLFDDVLNILDGKSKLLCEYKVSAGEGATEICEKASAILDAHDTKYLIESFNPFVLKWYKENRPDVIRGFLSQDFFAVGELNGATPAQFFAMKNMLTNFISRPDFIAFNYKHDYAFAFKVCTKILGAHPVCWTVRNADETAGLQKKYAAIIFDSFIPEAGPVF